MHHRANHRRFRNAEVLGALCSHLLLSGPRVIHQHLQTFFHVCHTLQILTRRLFPHTGHRLPQLFHLLRKNVAYLRPSIATHLRFLLSTSFARTPSHSNQMKSSPVKSSQVKSSQVKSNLHFVWFHEFGSGGGLRFLEDAFRRRFVDPLLKFWRATHQAAHW